MKGEGDWEVLLDVAFLDLFDFLQDILYVLVLAFLQV